MTKILAGVVLGFGTAVILWMGLNASRSTWQLAYDNCLSRREYADSLDHPNSRHDQEQFCTGWANGAAYNAGHPEEIR